MKKILFSALPIAALALLTLNPAEPLPIGSALPKADVKMKDISGKEVSFKDVTKKNGLLVMFSCNTCPIVQQYESRTVAACKEALANDIGVILLNSNEAYRGNGDSYDDMKAYAKKLDYTFPYVVDQNSEMADVFGANRTPECFLFDKTGKLVYHGGIDDNPDGGSKPYLATAFKGVLKGQKIDPEMTRSIGCTIKRKG
jgi:thioredoxin-related protein